MTENLEASLERCCRLCAEEQDVTVMIFSQEAEAMHLQNKLNKYLLIEVEEDDQLPKHICVQCCTKLQTVCDFIDTARKAQEVLLNRSILLHQTMPDDCIITSIKEHEESSIGALSDEDSKYTEMEISVDPMMVLQNSEEPLSPNYDNIMEDVTYLHGVDAENVTIKLIKKAVKPSDSGDEEDNKDGNQSLSCLTCKQSFQSDNSLKNHSWTHICENKTEKQYTCNTCLQAFDYKYDLVAHLKGHVSSGLCQLCGRVFRSERTYKAHMSVHLPSNKSFTCKICGRSYNTWGGLKTHSISHSSERPYQCHFCKKTFKRNQDLKFHINQHTGAKPYKCPFCEKCFASSGNCYSHRSRMHPGRRVEGKVKKRNNTPRENITPRPIAPKTTLTNVKGIYKYQCQICDHSFMKRDNFTYHMYQHTGEKPFNCSFCSEKFVTRRGLLIHHDKQHPAKDRPLALISKNVLLK